MVNRNLIIVKEGTYRQNLFNDLFSMMRELSQDTSNLHFITNGEERIKLSRSDSDLMLSTADKVPYSVVVENSFLESDKEFMLLAGIVKATSANYYLTQANIIDSVAYIYLNKDDNKFYHLDTNELFDNESNVIVPLIVINKIPDQTIWTLAINDKQVFVEDDLYLMTKKTIFCQVYSMDSSTQTVGDMLFHPFLSGDYKRANDTLFVYGEQLTLKLGPYSAIRELGLSLNSAEGSDLKIDTSIPYTVNSDGSFLTLDFSNVASGMTEYFKMFIPYDQSCERYMSNRKDLPLVEFVFVKKS